VPDSPAGQTPARLIVSRTLPIDVAQRQVYVNLDGERIATLLFGETVVRDIAPGPHQLRLNNTLVWKTLAFDAAPGEVVEFRFANRAGRLALPFLAVMGVAPLYLTVEGPRVQGSKGPKGPKGPGTT
jgi:hypothetical protein